MTSESNAWQRSAALIYRALGVEQPQKTRLQMFDRERLKEAYGDLIVATLAMPIIMDNTPSDLLDAIAAGWQYGQHMARKLAPDDAGDLVNRQEEGHA